MSNAIALAAKAERATILAGHFNQAETALYRQVGDGERQDASFEIRAHLREQETSIRRVLYTAILADWTKGEP